MKINYFKIIFCIFSPILVIGFMFLNGYPDSYIVFMNGKLASKHSYLEDYCMECHIPWKGINNESCTKCHIDDKHYNDDIDDTLAKKIRCFDCHQEHRGQSHDLNVAESLIP
jgi:hypothetical protein